MFPFHPYYDSHDHWLINQGAIYINKFDANFYKGIFNVITIGTTVIHHQEEFLIGIFPAISDNKNVDINESICGKVRY